VSSVDETFNPNVAMGVNGDFYLNESGIGADIYHLSLHFISEYIPLFQYTLVALKKISGALEFLIIVRTVSGALNISSQ